MLVEDSAAFVERLEVPADRTDKLRRDVARAELDALSDRWEVHLAESAVLELTRLVREEGIGGRARSLQRDLRAMRKHLRGKQEALAAGVARSTGSKPSSMRTPPATSRTWRFGSTRPVTTSTAPSDGSDAWPRPSSSGLSSC